MTNDQKPIDFNEFDEASPDEEVRRESRWNIERAKMRLVERRNWPQGTRPDGKLYSLQCSRAERAVMTEGGMGHDFELDADGELQFEFLPTLGSKYATEQPNLSEKTGTYVEIAELANRLNRIQESNGGLVHWVYAPVLIEPMKAAA